MKPAFDYKVIRDPLYGFVNISKLENEVINTPIFQRLNRIKQLSNTNLIYPSANHTRFEHSIGVLYLANIMTTKFNLDEEDKINFRLAALLHDIGHGPFSHSFEEVMRKINGDDFTHELITHYIIKNDVVLNKVLKEKNKDILNILSDNKSFLYKIISSDFDIDKMDYFRRDSYHLGVAYGIYDFERLLLSVVKITDPHTKEVFFGITEKGLRAYESFRLARFNLWEQVYEHHTRLILDNMLVKSLDYAINEKILNANFLNLKKVKPNKFCDYFSSLDDYSIQHEVISKSKGKAKKLMLDIRNRNLYKRAYIAKIDELKIQDVFKRNRLMKSGIDEIKSFENEIAKKSNVKKDDVIIHVQKSPIKGYLLKVDDPDITDTLLIKMNNNEIHQLNRESPLTIEYKTIRKIYVFYRGNPQDKLEIIKASEELFGAKNDYI